MEQVDTIFRVIAYLKYIDFLGLQNTLSDEQKEHSLNVMHEFESKVSWNKYFKGLKSERGEFIVNIYGFDSEFYLKRQSYEWTEMLMIINYHFAKILPQNIESALFKIMAISR